MAKKRITKSPTLQSDQSRRLTIHLSPELHTAFGSLSTMRNKSLSEMFESIFIGHLLTLPRRELDPIRGIVTAATGKVLRLEKGSGASAGAETPIPEKNE